MESSFTDVEKRFVLAEMIKASRMDVGVLVEFIKQHDVQTDWMLMQLPSGRNMNQCLHAAEVMFNMQIQPPTISPLKRKSISEMAEHASKKQVLGSPGDASPFAIARNVNTQSPGLGQPVSIQPRPNGYPPPTLTPSTPITPLSQNVVLPPRRRGRPPKAETLARQGASQPTHYPPISPAPLAPSPAQPLAPRPPSPGPSYQVWSAAPQEPKAKRKGRHPASDKQLPPPETIPRTLHGTPGSESDTRQVAGLSAEYGDWRDRPSAGRDTLPAILPLPRSPQPPGVPAREPPTTTSMEQTRQGGHTAAVN